jgi:hypothetical protein
MTASSSITVTIPTAASFTQGQKYNFVNHTSNILTLSTSVSDFIFNGNALQTTTYSVTVLPSESFELTSRGFGSFEWDATNGTALLRYNSRFNIIPNTLPFNTVANTAVNMDNINVKIFISSISSGINFGIPQVSPYIFTSTIWSWSGNASVYGNEAISYNQLPRTILPNSWYTMMTTTPSEINLANTGDTSITTLQDNTNNKIYNITVCYNSNISGGGGAISIIRIA